MDDAPASRDRADVEAWLAEREEESVRLVREALTSIVNEALDGVLGTLVASVTYDLRAIDGIPDAWLAFTHRWADHLMGTYLGGSMSAWLGALNPEVSDAHWFESVTNENAVSYMDGATNRLKGIGDNVWTSVRARLQQSLAQGYTIDALREEVARTAQVAIGRAETIARTETVGAYINGDMGGMQALGAKGPVEKVWRATSDARTRPSHVEASGQCVPFAADFTVGGVSMSHPHAVGAPADEVVNCRCYVEFLFPGDARPDGTSVQAPRAVPDRPRVVRPAPYDTTTKTGAQAYFREAAAARTEDEAAAIRFYRGGWSSAMNALQRGGSTTRPVSSPLVERGLTYDQRTLDDLSRAARGEVFEVERTAGGFRTVKSSTATYGDGLQWASERLAESARPSLYDLPTFRGFSRSPVAGEVTVGSTIVDEGMASVSLRQDVAEKFAKRGAAKLVVEVEVPAGTPVVSIGGVWEAELLLTERSVLTVTAVEKRAGITYARARLG